MKKVLNVDVREQEYVKDLEDKINKENAIAEAWYNYFYILNFNKKIHINTFIFII